MIIRVHGDVLARCNAAHPLEDLWRLVQDNPELIEETEGGIKIIFEVGAQGEDGEWWWDPMGEITLGQQDEGEVVTDAVAYPEARQEVPRGEGAHG